MARAAKKNKNELEERLKALQAEQRRLAREISSLSKDSGKGRAASSRRSTSKSAPRPRPSGAKATEMKAYLSTGSFRGTRKLRHERAVQRNKAIFMLIVAVVSMYMFLAWIF